MKTMIKIYNHSNNQLPQYTTEGSAGMDLRANLEEPIMIMPGDRKLIPTGIHIKLPVGYEAQIRPRSGLALKNGITVCNTPGTIDSDYLGDVGVILINHGHESFTVYHGDRIAQMVITKYETAEWEEVCSVDDLGNTERGAGGFGHSGVK